MSGRREDSGKFRKTSQKQGCARLCKEMCRDLHTRWWRCVDAMLVFMCTTPSTLVNQCNFSVQAGRVHHLPVLSMEQENAEDISFRDFCSWAAVILSAVPFGVVHQQSNGCICSAGGIVAIRNALVQGRQDLDLFLCARKS